MKTPRRAEVHSVKASGIVQSVGLAQIGVLGMPDLPGVASEVLGAVSTRGVNVPFVAELADQEGRSHIAFCIGQDRLQEALEAVNEVAGRVKAQRVVHRKGVALAAVYGPHFRDRPGSAAQAFSVIAEAGVNILAISTSVSSIVSVVDEASLETVVGALQKAFAVPDSAILTSAEGLTHPAKRGR